MGGRQAQYSKIRKRETAGQRKLALETNKLDHDCSRRHSRNLVNLRKQDFRAELIKNKAEKERERRVRKQRIEP